MPCCYLLPNIFIVRLLMLVYCQFVTTKQRFERYALPTDHIVVHSSNSNVSVTDWVVVISDESKVEFQEKFLRGKVWSGNSTLNFQPHGQTENFSAHDDVFSIFELSQMFLRSNRSTDGHSYMEYRADKNVNLIFSSGITQVNAFSGRWAHVSVVTWQLPVSSKVTIGSNVLSNLSRQLHIVSVNSDYNINITVFDAQMQMRYGNITVQITSDYRFLRIRSELYVVNLKTVISPFEISISDQEMIVRCENEQAMVQLLPNSSNIIIGIKQYSRMIIDRGREAVVLGGREVRPAGNINLLSMQLKILLKSGNISFIHASTNRSQIAMQSTSTNMASTAAHHAVDIIGGRINLDVFTGNISMNIIADTHLESLPTMITPFLTPQDNFEDIRIDDSNRNFPTDEQNSSNDSVSATQVPFTMVSHSVSNENSDFRAKVTAATDDYIPESAFTIPLLFLSTIKPTSTVSLVPPEPSLATILPRRTTSTPLSSTRSTALSYSEKITSHISFITKTTSTERISTLMDTSNWPKVDETTADTSNTSTVAPSSMLPTLLTVYSSPSFSPTDMPSSILSSSSATMFSSIPDIPVRTLTSSRTVEITISNMSVTSLIPQSFTSTSIINSSGSIPGNEYTDDENNENVQTDLIEFSWDNFGESSIPITTTTTVIAIMAHTDEGKSLAPEKARSTECIDIEPSKKQSTRSAWTPFASLPFEFPPTTHYPSTDSSRKGNSIQQNDEAKSEITFVRNEISKSEDWNKSAFDAPSVPMITSLKELFGKIIQYGSPRKENQSNHGNPETEFEQQQNFYSSSKFKRALSGLENEEIYEIQLKIPLDISLTAVELDRELLLALKKFMLFTNLNERQLPISEDAIRIKITKMERNGEYLKVLYSVSVNTKVAPYTSGFNDKINEASNCAQNPGPNGAELLFVIVGILIFVLFFAGTLLVCHKQCRKLFR
ncbi:unnamed protein product [Onchocerca ochengi]|uniref:Hyphal_reg_CWP domain-containing protein n=1 Tax=Onchocerca ochengi TaxID=42157 RepID=A0A182E2A6_ONCOC|nr:unnamed protein product [Onchocerca ochengi]